MSPDKSALDHRSKYRRSRSPDRDQTHRKDNSQRTVKEERNSPDRFLPTENQSLPDAPQINPSADERSHGEMKSPEDVSPAISTATVDLSRVKTEPVEYSPTFSEPDNPLEPSLVSDIRVKTEPRPEPESSSKTPVPIVPPVDGLSSEAADQAADSHVVKSEPLESFPERGEALAEMPSSVGANDVSVAQSATNSSHMEGYSSGMDSEESISDVERAAPGVVVEEKPVVKSEPKKYVKYFVPREKFKDAVIKEVGPYLKKFYKKHQISKEDYKEIFKKVIKKVCTSSSEKKRLVCTKAIHRLCHTYVKRARIQIKLDCKFGDSV